MYHLTAKLDVLSCFLCARGKIKENGKRKKKKKGKREERKEEIKKVVGKV